MATMNKLRCFAYEVEPNKWYAHCIDLCLDSTGPTFYEARAHLSQVIADYVQLVAESGSERHLLHRRSPLSIQTTYWKAWLLNLLRNLVDRSSHEGQIRTYNCPANSMANA